jgi:hypothetical protein
MTYKILFLLAAILTFSTIDAQNDSIIRLKKYALIPVKSGSIVLTKNDTLPLVKKDTLKHWKTGGFSLLSFNQIKLSHWSAGGENSYATTGMLNLFANYKREGIIWDNSLDLGYGLMKYDGKSVRKNEDKIELNSKVGYKAFGKVYYSSLLNYRTQFSKGYNYPNDSVVVSRFNAPGYVTLGLGLDYKPADFFSLSISPATGRLTIVADKALSDSGAYGVDRGKMVKPAFGSNLSAKFQKDVIKNVNIVSKLTLFNDYTDKNKDNRKNIDVNWEVMVNIKANKYLTTNISTNLIYDQNIIEETQFKEVLGVGLSYKF